MVVIKNLRPYIFLYKIFIYSWPKASYVIMWSLMLIKQWGLFLFSLQISNSLNWDVSLKLRFYDFLFCVNMCTSTLKVFHQVTLKHQPHLSLTHPVPTTHTVYIPAGLSCTSKKWSPTASVFNRLFESVDVSNKKSFLNTTMHFSLKCTGLCATYLSRAGLWRHSYECSAGTERVIKQLSELVSLHQKKITSAPSHIRTGSVIRYWLKL